MSFKLITYSLPSQYRKNAPEKCVARRIKVMRILNALGIKMGRSLFAVREKDFDIIKRVLDFEVVGIPDLNVMREKAREECKKLISELDKKPDFYKFKYKLKCFKNKVEILSELGDFDFLDKLNEFSIYIYQRKILNYGKRACQDKSLD